MPACFVSLLLFLLSTLKGGEGVSIAFSFLLSLLSVQCPPRLPGDKRRKALSLKQNALRAAQTLNHHVDCSFARPHRPRRRLRPAQAKRCHPDVAGPDADMSEFKALSAAMQQVLLAAGQGPPPASDPSDRQHARPNADVRPAHRPSARLAACSAAPSVTTAAPRLSSAGPQRLRPGHRL